MTATLCVARAGLDEGRAGRADRCLLDPLTYGRPASLSVLHAAGRTSDERQDNKDKAEGQLQKWVLQCVIFWLRPTSHHIVQLFLLL